MNNNVNLNSNLNVNNNVVNNKVNMDTNQVSGANQSMNTIKNATVIGPNTSSHTAVSLQSPFTHPTERKKSRHVFLFLLLFAIIIGMGVYIYMDYRKDLSNVCSPLVSSDTSLRKLDLDSSVVKDLYSKVYTNIREDLAHNTFDDRMKLYLAYRQIPNSKIYESNCNLFNNTSMPSYVCEESSAFFPRAFKEETLQLEIKKLFGENSNIENNNIQLENSCIGGFQYIAQRGEYVQGYCKEVATTKYNVDKKLIEAYVQGGTITLKEKVRYYGGEAVPDRLRNGIYIYTFKLDSSYNYIYISKTIE